MTADDGASPVTCPRCDRVGVDCRDKDALARAIRSWCGVHKCQYPKCFCAPTPREVPRLIRAFLGCPPR